MQLEVHLDENDRVQGLYIDGELVHGVTSLQWDVSHTGTSTLMVEIKNPNMTVVKHGHLGSFEKTIITK